MTLVREPAVSGLFYPAEPAALKQEILACLEAGSSSAGENSARPKALIVPHAGYRYSGPIAAAAYRQLSQWSHLISRVVLFGPSHRVPLQGLAAPSSDYFQTPFGNVPLDRENIQRVVGLPQVQVSDLAHQYEHSLETQLPFLQCLLGDFRLTPLVVGCAAAMDVADVMDLLWGGAETLLVTSSDLSHYHSYSEAQRLDRLTAELIDRGRPQLKGEDACGCYAVNGLLVAAQRHGLRANCLRLANSGDTAGDRSRVVGYGAWSFH